MFAFYRIIQALYTKLFTDSAVPGWTSLTIIVSFSFGILFIVLGIIGEYIARILEEVRSRPRFIVSERIGFEEAPREERTQGII
jgi:dolichol-phosphate mannosyltransferase